MPKFSIEALTAIGFYDGVNKNHTSASTAQKETGMFSSSKKSTAS